MERCLRSESTRFLPMPQGRGSRASFWWLEQEDMRYNYGEARWIALGLIGQRVYVCAFTRRNGSIRIISLRKGNSREQKIYYGTFS